MSLELLGEDLGCLLHSFQEGLLCFLLPRMNQLKTWIYPLSIEELAEIRFFPITQCFSMLDPSSNYLFLGLMPLINYLSEYSFCDKLDHIGLI